MTKTSARLVVWAPRALGAATCLFLSLFALDAFSEETTFLEALPAFIMHILPAVLLCVVLAVSWDREWIGGTTFVVLGLVYIGLARGQLDWILVVSGPLLLVGILFLLSWRLHSETHRHAPRS